MSGRLRLARLAALIPAASPPITTKSIFFLLHQSSEIWLKRDNKLILCCPARFYDFFSRRSKIISIGRPNTLTAIFSLTEQNHSYIKKETSFRFII
jgi:hypothetical protein